MKPTTLCPCGSGKSQFHCCGDHPKSKINFRSLVTWSFIILLGCGIAAITFSQPQDDVPSPAAGLTPAPIQLFNNGAASTTFPSGINLGTTPSGLGSTSGSKVPAPPNITNPSPWQYDIVTDRHYDPNHAHWHNGPPPTNPIAAAGRIRVGATAGGEVPAPPNIPNPSPGQYDVVTDRHYDANHGHWHSGSPPTNPVTSVLGSSSTSGSKVPAPPNITNPSPWQYDEATYRHYDPNHAHWHAGPPPNDPNAPAVSVSGSEVPAPPNITNPSPWQYDAVTDRHYDPNHAHWHDGLPPAN